MKLSFLYTVKQWSIVSTFFLFNAANIKLADDNIDYASGQNVALMDLDEAVQERISIKIKNGRNPSFALSNLKNERLIGGICVFASELHKMLLLMNESMSLYSDKELNQYTGHARVDYQDMKWFKWK